jgi:hypothetical protein
MFLIRYLLIGLVVYLIVRSFRVFGESADKSDKIKEPHETNKANGKKISKSVGEYVDYEEIKK